MPSKGYRKVSTEVREAVRARYLAGEPHQQLLIDFPGSESLFWSIVRGLRTTRVARTHAELVQRLQAISPEGRGWIAGIVDGEGWIGISRLRPRYYQPRVDVTSTTPSMQRRLQTLVGGNLSQTINKAPLRDTWRWSLWSITKVQAFVEVIGPLLVVKQEVAQEVLKFCRRHAEEARCTPSAWDERLYTRVRALNKRGRDD